MKLKTLRIQNFRGYEEETINFSDFNCIVGKNDVGKSAIFKALEKFFDYRSDASNVDYHSIIPDEKDKIYAEKCCPITLTATIECNDDGLRPFLVNNSITIQKKYEINPHSLKYHYHFGIIVNDAFFGEGGLDAVFSKKANNLKAPFKINGTNYILKPEKGKVEKLNDDVILIPTDMIYSFNLDLLFAPLPKFKMLTSSTPIEEIQELYVKHQLAKEFRDLNNSISDLKIKDQNKLQFDVNKIAINFNPIITEVNDKQIPLANRGEGYQLKVRNDIFRELAEADTTGDLILAFEEPEAHLHPSAQSDIIKVLKDLSDKYQIMITTHSPYIVADLVEDDNNIIIIVKRDKSNQKSIIVKQLEERIIDNYVSMNEINYIAFDLPSIEYHIELYGYLHEKLKEKYDDVYDHTFALKWDAFQKYDKNGHLTNAGNVYDIAALDAFLVNADNNGDSMYFPNHFDSNNKWYKEDKKTNPTTYVLELKRSLPYCVRNIIDHPMKERDRTPANQNYNDAYDNNKTYKTPEKIRESIEILRKTII